MNRFNQLFFVTLIFASQRSVCMDEPMLRLSGPSGSANCAGRSNDQQTAAAETESLTAFLHNKITTAQQTLSHSTSFSENEYHILLWHCRDILNIYAQENNNVLASYTSGGIMLPAPYGPEIIKKSVTEFLQAIKTPTALSLLTNLKATNFNF